MLIHVMKDERFSNPYIGNIRRGLWDFVRWQLGGYEDRLAPQPEPKGFKYPIAERKWVEGEPTVMWVNHCTFLLSLDGVNILTDPIWGKRCSPVPFLGPVRRHDPPMQISELPKIDVVLISHNHYDHLDVKSVMALHKRFPGICWFIPKGMSSWFFRRGIRNVKELRWWQESLFTKDGTQFWVSSVPAQHHSGRGIWDRDKTLWMGFVVQAIRPQKDTKTFYFVGDTAYNSYDFKKIGDRFKKIDLSLCPIGTYKPHRFMSTVHSSPEDAVNIHRDVRAALSIGMHWKTFKLSTEGMERPPFDLYLAMKKHKLNPETFLALEPGHVINW